MKKNKTQNVDREEVEEDKPWLLNNISPKIRKIAKDSARKHNVKVAEWVTHAIITTYQGEEGETVHVQTLSELMEEFPDKEFMKNWFIGLRGKIDELSKKIEETYKPLVECKPWWKFW
jgi:hypothetical protein